MVIYPKPALSEVASRVIFKEIPGTDEPKTPTFEKTENEKKTSRRENLRSRLIDSRRKKKKIERTLRATHCTDHTQSPTTAATGRPSPIELLSVCANGAPTIIREISQKRPMFDKYKCTYTTFSIRRKIKQNSFIWPGKMIK